MLATFADVEPLLIMGLAIAIFGSAVGICWFRVTAPSSFDKAAVRFILFLFSGIGLGTVILGLILKH